MVNESRRTLLLHLWRPLENAARESGERYTLVVIFLRGGADTLNMIVPYGDDDYYRLRPTIAISHPHKGPGGNAALPLDDYYGLHPKLAPLLPLFREGRLAIVQGVGSDNPSGSHFEAQDQMERGEAYGKTLDGGWLARYLRTRPAPTPISAVTIGPTLPESLRGAPTSTALSSLDDIQIDTPRGDAGVVSQSLAALYGAETSTAVGQSGREALDLLRRVEALRGQPYVTSGGAVYPEGNFGAGLREIARLTKSRLGLEIACLDLGGWDTHFFQGTVAGLQAESIDQLARGLSAFDADLGEHRGRVTTLVMTEFGRRNYENSSLGTDHGRGFALLALGDRINGGRVHGAWPGLKGEELLGPGGLPINYDYRSVLSEILTGVLRCDRTQIVFPHFTPRSVGLVRN
ncbi:MAG TPA: DUF1501 domain-containing protein [Pyrinomonadaceae bacterium]|nr:DUF1501 domain-containing protein [Pyrinomonadaceae bacterium]